LAEIFEHLVVLVFIVISEYKISIFFRKVFVDNIEIIIHYRVIFTVRSSMITEHTVTEAMW